MTMQLRTEFYTFSDGGRMRFAVLEPVGPVLGTMVIFPGRREFIEKKIVEVNQFCREKGLRIIAFEWRSHGLSDRFLRFEKRQRDHVTTFEIYLNDFREFYKNVIQKRAFLPFLTLGHSMGGHLMLRWLSEDQPLDVSHAILTAPMLAIGPKSLEGLAQFIATFKIKRNHGEDYAFFQHDYNDRDRSFHRNPLSQDRERFKIIEDYFDADTNYVVGGVTWQWIDAALQSMKIIRKTGYLSRIKIPVLVLVGLDDWVTPAKELSQFVFTIPHVDYYQLDKCRHDVLNESDTVLKKAWQIILDFLDDANTITHH